jgi:DGQHR domain-containing protein
MKTYRYKAIRARQASGHDVLVFAANAHEVLAFSEIERVSRNKEGDLQGFQRHQVASHIKEIRDYLRRDDALLPNAVILAFLDGVKILREKDGVVDIEISTTSNKNVNDLSAKRSDLKPGFVVDGQQRLSALSGLDKPNFQVFVSALICKDYNELRQQFVLINNTRPLPRALIYELLPSVEGLPERFTARQFAARVVDRLNFDRRSSLYGEIKQHTNPKGSISDLAMQKLVMNSASDGAIRNFLNAPNFEEMSVVLISNFFSAIRSVFASEWEGMTARTSRLKHGAGIVAMGFVMELLHSVMGASHEDEFVPSLVRLKRHTAWTEGQWRFGADDIRPWNGIQNTPSDIDLLAGHLVRCMKKEMRKLKNVANG